MFFVPEMAFEHNVGVAGASKGAGETASKAVADAYSGLKNC